MLKKIMLLTSAAFLYVIPFVASQWAWWVIFFAFIPLLYAGATERLSFKEGYFFGILFWAFHLYGVLHSIVDMAQGPLLLALIPSIFIVIYQAFFVALWFWITEKLTILLRIEQKPLLRLMLWVFTSCVYFYWLVHYCLCVFNQCEGYFLMHPLLPLAEEPRLLSLLSVFNKEVVTFILLASNGLLGACFLIQNTILRSFCIALGCMPWLAAGLQETQASPVPSWVGTVVHAPVVFFNVFNVNQLSKTIRVYLKDILKEYPQTQIVVFPESSFDQINLDTAKEIALAWDEKNIGKPLHVLIGAFNWQNTTYHNAAFWIYNGQLKQIYNKRHAMALTEGISGIWDMKFVHTLYYSDAPPITPSKNPRVKLEGIGDITLVPYICSELFFNNKPDDGYTSATIVALCNDLWAQLSYVRRLMYLTARFKAVEWRRDIIYASYFYGVYIAKNGTVSQLLTMDTNALKDSNRTSAK